MTCESLNQLSVVDAPKALEAVGQDTQLLATIAKAFLKESPEQLAKLQTAVDSKDAANVQQYAHALKGGVRFYGNQSIFDAAYRLECLGREGNLNQARPLLADFAVELELLSNDLRQMISILEGSTPSS